MNALELEDIKMQFNQKVLFENLDLAIEKGTINTIMGESGSGKSTLLNIIGLLLKPTAGAINILDYQNVNPNTRQAMLILRNDISYIFQNYALIDDETVYQNIELGLKYTKGNHHKKIESQTLSISLYLLINQVNNPISHQLHNPFWYQY